METGNGAAGDGDEQNREQGFIADVETNESRHIQGRVADDDTNYACQDHT